MPRMRKSPHPKTASLSKWRCFLSKCHCPGTGIRPVVLGQHTPHQMFVHGDIESQVHLIGNPLVAEARIPSLHLHDSGNQLDRGALWARSSASFGRKQLPVLTLHQQPLKVQYRVGLQNDCTTMQARLLHQLCAETRDDPVQWAQIRCPAPATSDDQKLLLQAQRLGYDGAGAARPHQTDSCYDQVNK